jgi:hypothetical protein
VNGEEKVNFNSELNEGKERTLTKEKDKRASSKISKPSSTNDLN